MTGSPDLDLAMAVEMSQLYAGKREASNQPKFISTEAESNTDEEEEISIAIELSLKEVQKKNRQSRFTAKSMSADGAEGELANNVQEKAPMHFVQISEETNATVRWV